ncbi:phosphate/phosphite/phosphonate ABC transporter substrate-binding protein [Blastopirellula marina]|uniref:Phosphate/phosphite/phosphonate ABC transporter substrate-binding protein n=1 Tax=Blastopirellula marina TaxID=124 RepID=A0A2S8F2Z1_9BACT|nr:phosphate/phosphite/phosphonate ABC transporter substrate-binding protein [Blastopirellula marina]PQO26477.1 phosphate/phosphite/phosphonate ABC transporter substrate-binding protein [Blastopirellula marina]PTL40790.1 phosphate/phosphite/phosphonate ABC transporter substrate-binding protein [Blastopirellula marina]
MRNSLARRSSACFMLTMVALLGVAFAGAFPSTVWAVAADENGRDGSVERPLRVMLIPADTGADTTLDDFKPVFNAIKEHFGLHFELRVGTSYGAVVEGLCANRVDVAFVGPVTYQQARKRGAAELLAVAVKENSSSYRAAVFARREAGFKQLADLRGKSLALGDINSTSSFRFPLAMLIKADVDPLNDLQGIVIAGSHSTAMALLREGHVEAAGCSVAAYQKGVSSQVIGSNELTILAVSPPIPNPPLVMHPNLPESVKRQLRQAFQTIHTVPGVDPDLIRGYGGYRYDRFDIDFPQEEFDKAIQQLTPVGQELISAIIERAADR